MRSEAREKAIFGVTCLGYLGAFSCLLVIGKAPAGIGRIVRPLKALWSRKGRRLADFRPDCGHSYLAKVSAILASDADGKSRVVIFENGIKLPRPHAVHDEIRQQGNGAYSHWKDVVFLSTSDNTDPRTNGRVYTYVEA